MEMRDRERAKERDLDFEREWQREMEDNKENNLQATATPTRARHSAANSASSTIEKDRTPHRYGTPPPPPRTQTPLALSLAQSPTPSVPRTKTRSVSAGRVQTQTNSTGSAIGGTHPLSLPLPPSTTPKRATSSSYLTPKKGPVPTHSSSLTVMVSPPPYFAGSAKGSLCSVTAKCSMCFNFCAVLIVFCSLRTVLK